MQGHRNTDAAKKSRGLAGAFIMALATALAIAIYATAGTSAAYASQKLTISTQVTIPKTTYTYDPARPATMYPESIKLADGTELGRGADYTVSHKNHKKAGLAKMYIKLNPNSITLRRIFGAAAVQKAASRKMPVPYWIGRADIAAAEVKTPPDQTYNGKAKKPALTVKYHGMKLKKGRDYTVKYTNNKNPGTAKATVKGKGNYKGTKFTTFVIKAKQSKAKNKKSNKVKATASASSKAKKMASLAAKDFKKGNEYGGAKYWKPAGFTTPVNWCALYVSYYAKKAGMVKNKSYPSKKTATCEDVFNYMKNKNKAKFYKNDGTWKPSKGSLVFIGDGNDSAHMGIVLSSDKNTMTVIEGNYNDRVEKARYTLGTIWDWIAVPR